MRSIWGLGGALVLADLLDYGHQMGSVRKSNIRLSSIPLTMGCHAVVARGRRVLFDVCHRGKCDGIDAIVGAGLAFVPVAGVPLSLAYSAHGGKPSLVNDAKYLSGWCISQ